MKNIFLALSFFLAVSSYSFAQDNETCGMDADDAWGGDTAAMNKFLATCGHIDTVSFDEHNKITKAKPHHQTIKMVLNTGKVLKVDSIFMLADAMPKFPGGESQLFEYLKKNIHYPATARTNKIQGRVYIQFVVERDGKISRAKIIRGIGSGCEEETIRVIKAMPKWTPGKVHDTPVQVQLTLPVSFRL